MQKKCKIINRTKKGELIVKKQSFVRKVLTLLDLQDFSEKELALVYAGQQSPGGRSAYSYNDFGYYDAAYYDAAYYNANYYDAAYYEVG